MLLPVQALVKKNYFINFRRIISAHKNELEPVFSLEEIQNQANKV